MEQRTGPLFTTPNAIEEAGAKVQKLTEEFEQRRNFSINHPIRNLMPSLRKLAKEFRSKQAESVCDLVQAPPPAPEPPLEAPQLPPEAPPNPKGGNPPTPIGTEALAHTCGHTSQFPVYEKDTFKSKRREKELARKCSTCRQADHEDMMTRAAIKKAEKEAEAALQPPKPLQKKTKKPKKAKVHERKWGWTSPEQDDRGRLPVGSEYSCKYTRDGNWDGRLYIPTPEGEKVFEGYSTGLFKLQRKLDSLWRVSTGEYVFILDGQGNTLFACPKELAEEAQASINKQLNQEPVAESSPVEEAKP